MIRLLWPIPSPATGRVEIVGERFHYLARVLRVREGDALELFDGTGRASSAHVDAVLADAVVVILAEALPARSVLDITLLQGVAKGERMEWILQKGTELGASAFAPVITERTIVKLSADRAAERLLRWARIVEDAARQSGRADTPRVHPLRSLEQAAIELAPGTQLLILDEEERACSLSHALADVSAQAPIALLIGPEGGLARRELAPLIDRGGRAVSLGTRTLRTETASLAALAVLLHLRGELG